MHKYDDLVFRGTTFTLNALKKLGGEVSKTLEISAPTSAIKNLQMIQLQKTILAIGMLSLYEAILQDSLSCRNGFKEAKEILKQNGQIKLLNRFDDFICAINVLKHGYGRSYNTLVSRSYRLPFILKLIDENYEPEVDVSEISTLIIVDDDFVLSCAELIKSVSEEIKKHRPDSFI